MRRLLEQHVIFERAGLGFVAVADQVARRLVRRKKRPLPPGREAGAAASAQARLFGEIEHVGRLQLAHRALPLLVAAALPVDIDVAQIDLADAGGQNLSDRHACPPFVDGLHHGARIHDGALRRVPKQVHVAVDEWSSMIVPLASPTPARVVRVLDTRPRPGDFRPLAICASAGSPRSARVSASAPSARPDTCPRASRRASRRSSAASDRRRTRG